MSDHRILIVISLDLIRKHRSSGQPITRRLEVDQKKAIASSRYPSRRTSFTPRLPTEGEH